MHCFAIEAAVLLFAIVNVFKIVLKPKSHVMCTVYECLLANTYVTNVRCQIFISVHINKIKVKIFRIKYHVCNHHRGAAAPTNTKAAPCC